MALEELYQFLSTNFYGLLQAQLCGYAQVDLHK